MDNNGIEMRTAKDLMKMDLERWGQPSFKLHLKLYFTKSGYRLIVNYRRCKALETKTALKLFYLLQRFKYNRICRKCGCDIPSHIKLGGGAKILHTYGLVMNSNTEIGENFTAVGCNTLIGGTEKGHPIIGDNVLIGGNATIVGNVRIGENAKIGAGALIVDNVPSDAIMINRHAEILNKT